jgi:hypothetical protein
MKKHIVGATFALQSQSYYCSGGSSINPYQSRQKLNDQVKFMLADEMGELSMFIALMA